MEQPTNPGNEKESARRWNKIAQKMNFGFNEAPSTIYYRQREIWLFKKFFKSLKGKKLLKLDLWNEVNNTGILFWAAEQEMEVYGLDISDFIVEKAKVNFEKRKLKGTFIVSDIRKIKFPDNYFDFVYTMGTIEHVPDYGQAVKEIHRVLRPGGTAIIGVPNKYDPFLRPWLVKFFELLRIYPYSPEKAFSSRELQKVIRENSLKLQERTGILFMPGILRIIDIYFFKIFRPSRHFMHFCLYPFWLLEKNFPFLQKRGYLLVCVASK